MLNAHVYVYVYGYKVRLHVYKNCVNVAALVTVIIVSVYKPAEILWTLYTVLASCQLMSEIYLRQNYTTSPKSQHQ